MARQLWLLRHGTRRDADRRLTERGERQARAAGVALAKLGVKFDAILYSPKVRASQTAELAAEAWSAQQRKRLREHPPLAGGFDAQQALEALAGVPPAGCVLLVGHEPDLSSLAAELTGGRLDLKKGGVAALRLDGPSGELVVLLRPRELGLIAGVPSGGE
jgi:phosphohistidine phosphatase